MAVQIYASFKGVKQGGFKGESNQKGREGTIPCVGFSYGVIVPRDVATGQASGKRQRRPLLSPRSGEPLRHSSMPLPTPTRSSPQ